MRLSRSRERLLRRIGTRRGREAERVVLLEGGRALTTALAHGAELLFVIRTESDRSTASDGPGFAELEDSLARSGAEVIEVSKEEFKGLAATQAPQGILGVAVEPRTEWPPTSVDLPSQRSLVLDGVQDPGNVGTLVRAAAAFGVSRVILLDGSADPWESKAVRASAGLVFAVPIHMVPWEEAREWILGSGAALLLADGTGRDVRDGFGFGSFRRTGPGWILVLGNEGRGARSEVRAAATDMIAVPLAPGVDSLNVAMAGSILLWMLGPALETPS